MRLYLIEILHQTTTAAVVIVCDLLLYLIEILHQTTTGNCGENAVERLYLIEILHQTTTAMTRTPFSPSCILSKFYIKPQPYRFALSVSTVVSYRNSTSNHNREEVTEEAAPLYLIEILHQTTTWCKDKTRFSKLYLIEILHQTTTEVHDGDLLMMLYLIEILHQTTTTYLRTYHADLLYLIEILHQTTT